MSFGQSPARQSNMCQIWIVVDRCRRQNYTLKTVVCEPVGGVTDATPVLSLAGGGRREEKRASGWKLGFRNGGWWKISS